MQIGSESKASPSEAETEAVTAAEASLGVEPSVSRPAGSADACGTAEHSLIADSSKAPSPSRDSNHQVHLRLCLVNPKPRSHISIEAPRRTMGLACDVSYQINLNKH